MPCARVLVVEDDLHTRRMIALVLTRDRLLRYRRLEVVTAANGLEGLKAFKAQTPRLLITDLLMPEMDGFELIEEIRAMPEGRELPILVTSAVIRNAQLLRKLERDFDVEVQLKPFSPRVLADRVRQLLHQDRPAEEGLAAAAEASEQPFMAATWPPADPESEARREGGLFFPSPAALLGAPPASGAARPAPPPAPLAKRPPPPPPPVQRRAPTGDVAPAPTPTGGVAPAPTPTGGVAPAPTPTGGGEIDDANTVAALLLRFAAARRSGTLDLQRGRMRKVVHMLGGCPIFVQSNLRAETLGQLLIKRGGLTPEQHARVVELARRERIKYGEALVRARLKTEAEVLGELVEQTRHKLAACLRWRSGSWTYVDDPEVGQKVPNCTVDPLETVFTGLRDGDVHAVLAKLFEGGIERRLVLVSEQVERYDMTLRGVFGSARIDALRAHPTLSELLADEPAAAMAADALVCAGLGRFEALPARRPERASTGPAPLAGGALSPPGGARASQGPEAAGERSSSSAEAPALEALLKRRATPEAVSTSGLKLSGAWATGSEERSEADRIARALVESAYLGLHDKSHYEVLGVIPSTDANGIEVAFTIKRQQFDLARFRERDIGEAYAHLEEICAALDEAYAVLSDPARRAHYDATELPQRHDSAAERAPALRAEEAFAEGQRLLSEGNASAAMGCFERAIELDDQPEYRVQEALAYFLAEGPSREVGAEAMVRVQAALAVAPEQPLGHLVAARISRSLGAQEEALEHLRQALHHEPLDRDAFDLLELTLLEQGELAELEAEYRRAIFRIGSRDRAFTSALWKRLVLLYRDRLNDPQRAWTACDAAFRLNPADDELRAVLKELLDKESSQRSWPQAALGYRALLRGDPSDVGPVIELAALHRAEGRQDAAAIAAQIALWRGAEPALLGGVPVLDETPELPVVRGRLDEARWRLLIHPDEDPALRGLFTELAPLLEREDPLTAADLGLEADGVAAGSSSRSSFSAAGSPLSLGFSAVLDHTCAALGVATPKVLIREELGEDIVAPGVTPPLLLVGGAATQVSHRRELVFRLARAVTLLQPARRLVGWRSPGLLCDYLLAAVRAVVAMPEEIAVGHAESERSAAVRRLIEADDALLEACEPWVRQLHDRPGALDLGRWKQGAQRTAERAGLLLCGDVRAAGRVIVEVSREAEIELCDFALSEPYADLRAQVGLAG